MVEARNRQLPEWFSQIQTGQIKLPRFQRFEAWSHNTITSLLETVLRGLPAGAALVLAVGDEEKFVSRSVVGAPDFTHKPNEQLLDGQQRITALWRSLHDDYENRTYFVGFEASGAGEIPRVVGQKRWRRGDTLRPIWADDPKGVHERGLIPLRLLRPVELGEEIVDWCERAVPGDTPDDLRRRFAIQQKITLLRGDVAAYNIPFLSLAATTPPDVALDVFIKMNTSFARLTPYDVIVAQFEGRTGKSLHDLVAELVECVPALPRYMEPSDLILEVAALREDRAPTQASYLRLDLQRLLDDWEEITAGIAFTIALLEEEQILDGKRLPAVAVLRIIAALHEHLPQLDELGNARHLLRKFIWRAFFTDRYESAAATASIQDFRALRATLTDGSAEAAPPIFDEERYPLPTREEIIQASWPATRDSLGRAILDVTIRAGARDLADDATATRDQIQKREYHHLFPAALLDHDGRLDSPEINRALNCALITWNTNRAISAKEPIKYLRERVERAALGETEIRRRLTTHYIPYEELNVGNYAGIDDENVRAARIRADYEAFLEARADLVLGPIAALCNGDEPLAL